MNKSKIGKTGIVMSLSLMTFMFGITLQANQDQSQIYNNSLNQIPQNYIPQTNQSSLITVSDVQVHLTAIVHYTPSHGLSPGQDIYSRQLLARGYVPDCSSFCIFGINYALDPTVVMTNNGRDFEQCKVFGSSGSITCTGADLPQYLSVSVSSGYTPLVGDTSCHATVQTTNGYSVATGTITAGTAGTTVTTTISKTWTDTTSAVASIDLACIQTENTGGGNIILYAEGQIGSTTTNVGDSLTTQWLIARS